MHTVKESGTYVSKDETKSTQLTAGDVIADEEAADLGLISEKDADKAKDEKAQGSAPENKSKA